MAEARKRVGARIIDSTVSVVVAAYTSSVVQPYSFFLTRVTPNVCDDTDFLFEKHGRIEKRSNFTS